LEALSIIPDRRKKCGLQRDPSKAQERTGGVMPYRWLIIIGVSIGIMIGCWYFKCLEWADRQADTMTVYEQMLKGNPTAAGKK
jgi:hypothetical protein